MKNNRINFWMAAFFCLAGILIGTAGAYAFMKYNAGNTAQTNITADQKTQPQEEKAKKYSFDFDGFLVLGNNSADVTVVEFADYQCPACGFFSNSTFGDLKTKYIDTGKIKFVFKDFPLFSIHPQSEMASEAAHCASDQEKYFEMHEMLFKRVKEWSGNSKAEAVFNNFAKELKLDTKQFSDCMKTNKYKEKILASVKEALNAEAEGTPTFYINGEKTFFGAYPIESFDAALAKLGIK